jgi:hypothetical protein
MLHFRAKSLILKGVKKDSKKSGQAQAPSIILGSVNGEMKMYKTVTISMSPAAWEMKRQRAHSREANFGSGRADELSKMFGKLADEYAIYKACAPAPHKSFDEWLES